MVSAKSSRMSDGATGEKASEGHEHKRQPVAPTDSAAEVVQAELNGT